MAQKPCEYWHHPLFHSFDSPYYRYYFLTYHTKIDRYIYRARARGEGKNAKGAALGTRQLLKKLDQNFCRKRKMRMWTDIMFYGRKTAPMTFDIFADE